MILLATGLKREARLLESAHARIIAGGGQSGALEAALNACARDADAILSIGLAGALAPYLRPGHWVIGVEAIEGATRTPAQSHWRATLERVLPQAISGGVVGVDDIAADLGRKRALAAETGAVAVDMETHIAARVARRWRKPFAIARAISDDAEATLPPAARVGMRADGGMDIGAVLVALARAPAQLPDLIGTALDAEAGFRALRGARAILGEDFGFGGEDLSP